MIWYSLPNNKLPHDRKILNTSCEVAFKQAVMGYKFSCKGKFIGIR